MSIKYRPEIDGLRAVAVVAVVAYHAGLVPSQQPLPGGFLGVDVFFVISGYLIASIILSAINDGTFTFANFYERRARRILPALFVVVAATFPLALLSMTPEQLTEFGGSALSALLFYSNLWFFQENTYNADVSSLKPLLHVWSLALEEQFYFVIPILLVAVAKYASAYTRLILVTLLLLSFGCALYTSVRHPEAAFYLLPARAWELLAGALIAKLELDGWRERRWPRLEVLMPAVGLLLIAVSLVAFDDSMLHPNFATTVPIIGTLLIIWFARPGEFVTHVLASRPFVAVGLISYSLYLWHFPIFAFANIRALEPITYADRAWQVAIAAGLAVATYALVEQPARKAAILPLRKFAPTVGAAAVLLIAVSSLAVSTQGFPARFGKVSTMVAAANGNDHNQFRQNGKRCMNRPVDKRCQFPANVAGAQTIVNVGDSIGTRLSPALLSLAQRSGLNYVDITFGGCPYIVGGELQKVGRRQTDCRSHVAAVQKFLLSTPPSIIVISGRYPRYLSGREFDNREGGVESDEWDFGVVPDAQSTAAGLLVSDLVKRSIDELIARGHTIVLIYPIPETGWHIPRQVFHMMIRSNSETFEQAYDQLDVSTSLPVYRERTRETRSIFDGLQNNPRLLRVFPERKFCSEKTGRCQTHGREGLYYADENHPSPLGAQLIVDQVANALAGVLTGKPGRLSIGSSSDLVR